MRRIGIICAMPEELRLLKNSIKNSRLIRIENLNFYLGVLYSQPVIIVESGIGKVQAGLTAGIMIAYFHVGVVIHSGSAGGIGKGIKIGDLVISTGTAYHDVNVTNYDYKNNNGNIVDYKYGQLPNQPLIFKASSKWQKLIINSAKNMGVHVKRGLIVSGDQFISSNQTDKKILDHFPNALACEMEGAAIGQVAHQFNTHM